MLVPLPRSVFTLWIVIAVGLASCVSGQFGGSPFVTSVPQLPTEGTTQWATNQQSYQQPAFGPSDSSILSQPFQTNSWPPGNNYNAPLNTGQFGNSNSPFVSKIPTTSNGQWATSQQNYMQPSSPFLSNSGQFGNTALVPSIPPAGSTQVGLNQPNFAQPFYSTDYPGTENRASQANTVPSRSNFASPSNTGQIGNPALVPSIPPAGSTQFGLTQPNIAQPSFLTNYPGTENRAFQTNSAPSINNFAPPSNIGQIGNPALVPSIPPTGSTQWGLNQQNFAQPSFLTDYPGTENRDFQTNSAPSINNFAPPSNTGQVGNSALVPSIPPAGSTQWGLNQPNFAQPSFLTDYPATENRAFQTNSAPSINNFAPPSNTGRAYERTAPSIFDFSPTRIADTTDQFNSQPVSPPFDPDAIARSLIQSLPNKVAPPSPVADLIAQNIPPLFTPPAPSQTFQQGQQPLTQQKFEPLPSVFDTNMLTKVIQNNEKLQDILEEENPAEWAQNFPPVPPPPLPAFGVPNTPQTENVEASPISNFPPPVLPAVPNYSNLAPLPVPPPSSSEFDIIQPIVPIPDISSSKTPFSPIFNVPSETPSTDTVVSPLLSTNPNIQQISEAPTEGKATTAANENPQPDSEQILPIQVTPEQILSPTADQTSEAGTEDEMSEAGTEENNQEADTAQTAVADSSEDRKTMHSFLHSFVSSGLALLKKMIENERIRNKSRSEASRFKKQQSKSPSLSQTAPLHNIPEVLPNSSNPPVLATSSNPSVQATSSNPPVLATSSIPPDDTSSPAFPATRNLPATPTTSNPASPPSASNPSAPPAESNPPAPLATSSSPALPATNNPPAPPAISSLPAPPAVSSPPAPPANTNPPAPPSSENSPAPPAISNSPETSATSNPPTLTESSISPVPPSSISLPAIPATKTSPEIPDTGSSPELPDTSSLSVVSDINNPLAPSNTKSTPAPVDDSSPPAPKISPVSNDSPSTSASSSLQGISTINRQPISVVLSNPPSLLPQNKQTNMLASSIPPDTTGSRVLSLPSSPSLSNNPLAYIASNNLPLILAPRSVSAPINVPNFPASGNPTASPKQYILVPIPISQPTLSTPNNPAITTLPNNSPNFPVSNSSPFIVVPNNKLASSDLSGFPAIRIVPDSNNPASYFTSNNPQVMLSSQTPQALPNSEITLATSSSSVASLSSASTNVPVSTTPNNVPAPAVSSDLPVTTVTSGPSALRTTNTQPITSSSFTINSGKPNALAVLLASLAKRRNQVNQPSSIIAASQAQSPAPPELDSNADEDYIPWAFTIPSDRFFDDANKEILDSD